MKRASHIGVSKTINFKAVIAPSGLPIVLHPRKIFFEWRVSHPSLAKTNSQAKHAPKYHRIFECCMPTCFSIVVHLDAAPQLAARAQLQNQVDMLLILIHMIQVGCVQRMPDMIVDIYLACASTLLFHR